VAGVAATRVSRGLVSHGTPMITLTSTDAG